MYYQDYSSVKLYLRDKLFGKIYERFPLCRHCAFIQLYYWLHGKQSVSMHSVDIFFMY